MGRFQHCTDYNGQTVYFEDRRKSVNFVVRSLKKIGLDNFDAIAVSGYSGIGIASIVADKLKKNIVIVRKSGEEKNSWNEIEAPQEINNIVIVDDLIASGSTIRRIAKKIHEHYVFRYGNLVNPVNCVGIILYYSSTVHLSNSDNWYFDKVQKLLRYGQEHPEENFVDSLEKQYSMFKENMMDSTESHKSKQSKLKV